MLEKYFIEFTHHNRKIISICQITTEWLRYEVIAAAESVGESRSLEKIRVDSIRAELHVLKRVSAKKTQYDIKPQAWNSASSPCQ